MDTLSLRILSIFIIAAVSAAGCGTAFLLKSFGGSALESVTYRIFKALAAGVVCGVGLIHVLPDAVEALSEVTDFPLAYTISAYAVVLTLALEHWILGKAQKLAKSHGGEQASQAAAKGTPVLDDGNGSSDGDEAKVPSQSSSCQDFTAMVAVEENHTMTVTYDSMHVGVQIMQSPPQHAHKKQGNHGCAGVDQALSHNYTGKAALTAQLLEVGIVMHSVIIGVGLGAITDSFKGIQVLTLALCIHQYFEGLGLGACIADANLPRARVWSMCGIFSITTSLGVALGIIATVRSDSNSTASLVLQGVFGAAGAGILIYMALVTLIASDFADEGLNKRPYLKAGMFAALNAGITIMAVLAIWA